MNKERFQNPAIGDTVTLRIFSFNANAPKDFASIEKVEIYYLDPTEVSDTNSDGRILVETIDGSDVTKTRTGEYSVSVDLEDPKYVIGYYLDVWYVTMEGNYASTIEQNWQIYPSLWFTTPAPVAYDFSFDFRPNKIRKGSKRYIIVSVTPNVPTGSDLQKYYSALVVSATIRLYIEMVCGDCMPTESDLRAIVDGEEIVYRERNEGFYQIDTEDWDEGIYDIWCEMDLGDNLYVSEKQQIQIY